MAVMNSHGIQMWIDVTQSEKKNKLIVGWSNPQGTVGGYLDVTDLFFSIRDYWECTIRKSEKEEV